MTGGTTKRLTMHNRPFDGRLKEVCIRREPDGTAAPAIVCIPNPDYIPVNQREEGSRLMRPTPKAGYKSMTNIEYKAILIEYKVTENPPDTIGMTTANNSSTIKSNKIKSKENTRSTIAPILYASNSDDLYDDPVLDLLLIERSIAVQKIRIVQASLTAQILDSADFPVPGRSSHSTALGIAILKAVDANWDGIVSNAKAAAFAVYDVDLLQKNTLVALVEEAKEEIKDVNKRIEKYKKNLLTLEEKEKLKAKEEKLREFKKVFDEYNSHLHAINRMMLRATGVSNQTKQHYEYVSNEVNAVTSKLSDLNDKHQLQGMTDAEYESQYTTLDLDSTAKINKWKPLERASIMYEKEQFKKYKSALNKTQNINTTIESGKIPSISELESVIPKLKEIRLEMSKDDVHIKNIDNQLKIDSGIATPYNGIYRKDNIDDSSGYVDPEEKSIPSNIA